MEQQCIRANYDTIEHLLRSPGYEIVWQVDDDDWDALNNGWNPQFHIRHDGRVYKIQYKDHELFKVIYEFDPSVYCDYTTMSKVVVEVMSEFENTPMHIAYKDERWRVWVGGYHLSQSDIEFYIKGYLIIIDRVIRRCQERYIV